MCSFSKKEIATFAKIKKLDKTNKQTYNGTEYQKQE
jgi:hypothetical protein